MTEVQAEIYLSEMDIDQQTVFQLFVGLGTERSLLKLTGICKEQKIKVSYSTIKRWSTEFKWLELAKIVARNLSDKLAKEMLPAHLERAKKQLEAIDTLEDRFYERLKLDPDSLDPSERERAIDVSLSDFFNLIKTRRLIMGDPTQEKVNTTVTHRFDDEQLDAAVDIIAQKRYGLPSLPKTLIKNVSVSDAD